MLYFHDSIKRYVMYDDLSFGTRTGRERSYSVKMSVMFAIGYFRAGSRYGFSYSLIIVVYF